MERSQSDSLGTVIFVLGNKHADWRKAMKNGLEKYSPEMYILNKSQFLLTEFHS